MPKISGLDQLSNQLTEAEAALASIDGELGTVSFDPDDPASIEAAIQHVNAIVDERLGAYAGNPIIAPLIDGMKERYREAVLERAAALRLERAEGGDGL